jgi:hypothetical protein
MRNDEAQLACARVEGGADGPGTAYLVSETWAVTCAHVVANVAIGGEVQLFFPTAAGEAVHWIERRAALDKSEPDLDCATLRLTEPFTSVRPLRLGKGCSLGDTWWSFGYPVERGKYGVPCVGQVLLPEGRSRRGQPVIHLYSDPVAAGQGAVIGGASGSPVLVAGRVVGHISRVSLGRQVEDADLDHLKVVIEDRVEDEKEKIKAHALLKNMRESRRPARAEGGYVFAVPVRFVREILPTEVQYNPPADLLHELLSYLDALVVEANRVPPYYPPRARMERVRVRVRVSSERQKFDCAWAEKRESLRRGQGYSDPEEAFGAYLRPVSPDSPVDDEERDQREERPRVQVLDWDRDVRDKLRRGVILADPGLGKTWLLKWEAGRCAAAAAGHLREAAELNGVTLPIYLRLSEVAEALATLVARRRVADSPVPSLADAVIEAVGTGSSSRWSDQMLKVVRERLGTEHSLLLLDAFDEVPSRLRARLLDALSGWVQGNPQSRILFTSRVVGYQWPWPISGRSEAEGEMQLLPFADDQMAAFVQAFFDGNTAAIQEVGELLRRAPQVRGLTRNPLLLGLLCAQCREELEKPAGERRDLTRLRRADLFRFVLGGMLWRRWRAAPGALPESEAGETLELVEQMAFRLFVAGKELFTIRDVREALRSAHLELYPGQGVTPAELTRLSVEFCEQDGMLVKAGVGEEAPYLFLHLTIHEYLAACYLARRINRDHWDAVVPLDAMGHTVSARELVDRMAWLPWWQEVIVLLAGSLRDVIPLLELLSDDGRDDIFRHRLALGALCLSEIKVLLDTPRYPHHQRLIRLRDEITTNVFGHWICHAMASTEITVRHLDAAVASAGRVLGRLDTPWLPTGSDLLVGKGGLLYVRRILKRAGRGTPLPECLVAVLRDLGEDPERGMGNAGRIITEKTTRNVIDALLSILPAHDLDLGRAAAVALGRLGLEANYPEVLDVLLLGLHEGSSFEQAPAQTARPLGVAVTPNEIAAHRKLLRSRDLSTRCRAAIATMRMGQGVATDEILAALLSMLREDNLEAREAAAKAIAGLALNGVRLFFRNRWPLRSKIIAHSLIELASAVL